MGRDVRLSVGGKVEPIGRSPFLRVEQRKQGRGRVEFRLQGNPAQKDDGPRSSSSLGNRKSAAGYCDTLARISYTVMRRAAELCRRAGSRPLPCPWPANFRLQRRLAPVGVL